jgi:hypothetical protein
VLLGWRGGKVFFLSFYFLAVINFLSSRPRPSIFSLLSLINFAFGVLYSCFCLAFHCGHWPCLESAHFDVCTD